MSEGLVQKLGVQVDNSQVVRTMSLFGNLRSKGKGAISGISSSLSGLMGRFSTLQAVAVGVMGAIATAVAGVTAALGKAVSNAKQFEDGFSQVSTLVDTSSENMEGMARGLIDIYQQLPVSIDKLNGALYQTVSAGVDASDALEVVEIAARGAIGGATDVQTAVDGMTSAINGFQLEADDAQSVADKFFVAVREGKTTFGELASNIGTVASQAEAMNVTLDEALSGIAAITQTGISTSEAVTQVTSVLAAFQKFPERFREIGINPEELLKEEGFRTTLNRIVEAAERADQNLIELFGRKRATRGIQILTGPQSDQFVNTLNAMEDSAGEANTAFEKMQNTASNLSTTLFNRVNGAFTEFGRTILPTVNDALRSVLNWVVRVDSTLNEQLLRTLESMEGADQSLIQLTRLRKRIEELRSVREDIQSASATGIPLGFETGISGRTGVRMTEEVNAANLSIQELREQLDKYQQRIQEVARDPDSERFAKRLVSRLDQASDKVQRLIEKRLQLQQVNEQLRRAERDLSTLRQEGALGLDLRRNFDPQEYMNLRERLRGGGEEDDTSGGDGDAGEAGPTEEELERRRRARELLRQLERAQRLKNAATEEERKKLQRLFEVQRKIRQLQDVKGDLSGERLQRAEEILQSLKERRDTLQDELDSMGEYRRLSEDAARFIENMALEPDPDAIKRMSSLSDVRDELESVNEDVRRLRNQLSSGEISEEEFFKRLGERMDEAQGFARELYRELKRMGLLTPELEKAFRKLFDRIEQGSKEAEDLAGYIQNVAQGIGGIADLAEAFGNLSDEARQATNGITNALSAASSLAQLSSEEGGLGELLGSASGALSAAGPILGVVGGLATTISGVASALGDRGLSDKEMRKLRQSIGENVEALRQNTQALFEQSVVGGDISQSELQDASGIMDFLTTAEATQVGDARMEREFGRLESTAPIFEGSQELSSDTVSFFREFVPKERGGGRLVDPKVMERIAREWLFGDLKTENVTNRIFDFIPYGASVRGSTVLEPEDLRKEFGENFETFDQLFDELQNKFSEFGDSVAGISEEIQVRRDDLGQGFETLRSTLAGRVEDLQGVASAEILGVISDNLEGATKDEVSGMVEDLREVIVGDQELGDVFSFFNHGPFEGMELEDTLGDVTPSEFRDLLDTIESTTDVEGGGNEGGGREINRATQVGRTITEHQANQLLSFQQEQVFLLRQVVSHTAALRSIMSRSTGLEADQSSLVSISPSQEDGSRTVSADIYVEAEETPESIAQKLQQALDEVY